MHLSAGGDCARGWGRVRGSAEARPIAGASLLSSPRSRTHPEYNEHHHCGAIIEKRLSFNEKTQTFACTQLSKKRNLGKGWLKGGKANRFNKEALQNTALNTAQNNHSQLQLGQWQTALLRMQDTRSSPTRSPMQRR
jgi:hypothetical protein